LLVLQVSFYLFAPSINRTFLTEKNPLWFRHWPKDVSQHIDYPNVPLQNLLEASAKNFPLNTALTFEKSAFSYARLDALANQFANALIGLGVKKGDRVALFLANMPQFVIAYFGVLKAGAVVAAISPLHREREVEYQLNDSEAETVVVLDSLYPLVERVKEKTPLKNVLVTGFNDFGYQIQPAPGLPDVESFKKLLTDKSSEAPEMNFNSYDDLAVLQYTGGTTGTPKAAMLTHQNLLSNALAFAAWIKGDVAKETFLTALPLFHIYGMTTSLTVPVSLAAKIVLVPKFEPQKILNTIQTNKVTVFCGVPTMYCALVADSELSEYDLTSIRVCISGGSSLPPQVQMRFMEVTGGFLAEGYGLTEASPVTHCSPVDRSMPLKMGSIGLPLSDTEAQLVDLGTGAPLKQGAVGELAVKGPQVMKGYWQNPAETKQVLGNGWLLTGDIARMDGEGYFYIVDRKKDLIKTRGYSVYPRELEDMLYEHPAVKLCAVVGKPDVRAGEVPVAFVVLKNGATASSEEIMAFVNCKVASYKAIREVQFRSELPLSGAGKVLRRKLLEKQ
jgi:long-chain acyl-CoA synthetase